MRVLGALCCAMLLLLGSCGQAAAPGPEIFGVALGMSREEAHERLKKLGKLEREERKQQEVWALQSDQSYSHLILAYNKEYTRVRFLTAVAKDGGRPVRYGDVLDVKKARLATAENNHAYTLEVPAADGRPGYVVKAIGSHPDYLKYYSVERVD